MQIRNKLPIILRFIVSFALLLVLVWIMRKDAREVFEILKSSNKVIIFFAIFINALLSVALAYRLKLLMSGQNVQLSINDAVYLTFIGYFFNNFLPTSIGGDIAKAHYASMRTDNRAASYAAVLTDRILGLIATLLIAITGIFFIGKAIDNKFIIWMVPGLLIFTVVFMAMILRKSDLAGKPPSGKSGIINKIKEKILKLYAAINLYRKSPTLLIKAIALSIGLQAMAIFSVYLFILCIGGDIALFRLFLIIPLVWAVSMLPSLNGLGVREGAFIYFLKSYIGHEKAFAVSLLWLGMIMLYSVAGGFFHLIWKVDKGQGTRDRGQGQV